MTHHEVSTRMRALDVADANLSNSGPIYVPTNARPFYAYYSMVGFKIEWDGYQLTISLLSRAGW